jgi:hypothetical protein
MHHHTSPLAHIRRTATQGREGTILALSPHHTSPLAHPQQALAVADAFLDWVVTGVLVGFFVFPSTLESVTRRTLRPRGISEPPSKINTAANSMPAHTPHRYA